MELIDKSAVVAEIERKIEAHKETLKNCDSSISEMVLKGSMSAYQSLLYFLDTLEVKEVDLEKEIANWWNAHYSSKGYTFEGYTGHYLENSTLIEITKHFFELGLKTQKGGEE